MNPRWTAVVGALLGALLVVLGSLSTPARSPTEGVEYAEHFVPLPGFDPLFGYVYGNNCRPSPVFGCGAEATNYSQIPVLANSPEQPSGIYYVDNGSRLVRVPVGGGPATVVANVTLLHQEYAQYAGMTANEFFLPYGYDEALFYGTGTANGLYVETVNLTTGATDLRNSGIPLAAENQQATMIAPDVVLVVSENPRCLSTNCPANLTALNMTDGTTSNAGVVPFFEANNLYWVPPLRQLLDVEADGSFGDEVEQWDEQANGTFALAAEVPFASLAEPIDWVDGVAYNATGSIAFSAGGMGEAVTFVLAYSNGRLTPVGERSYVAATPAGPRSGQLLNLQQYVFTGDWDLGGYVNGTQYLFDPWTGATEATGEPFTDLAAFNVCDGSCFLGEQGAGTATLIDWHASVARNDPFWSVAVATEGG
jgi:hypothetical protein